MAQNNPRQKFDITRLPLQLPFSNLRKCFGIPLHTVLQFCTQGTLFIPRLRFLGAGYLRASTAERPGAGIETTEVVTVEYPHLLENLYEPRHYLRLACSTEVQTVQLLRQHLSHCNSHKHFCTTGLQLSFLLSWLRCSYKLVKMLSVCLE